jgi:hypothetical protein
MSLGWWRFTLLLLNAAHYIVPQLEGGDIPESAHRVGVFFKVLLSWHKV